jgi:hypothetical protein
LSSLKVLIGREESGVVRRAFRAAGHNAWSCDLLPARDGGEHFQMDVIGAITHIRWDLIILHPPCQYIAVSGNRWHAGTPNRANAKLWTYKLWLIARGHADRVCLENPVGLQLPDYKPQWIQPWQFGHPETKKTGLWLHNLPPLVPTNIVEPTQQRIWRMPPGPNRQRDRSETFSGIAEAMANQWGSLEP